jgi:non-heme chloroperoxidase
MRLPYVEHGDRDGVPVLFLHGYSDTWRSWEPVLPHLPESIRAIAVTQRGHGDAERPASGYLIDDLAADVGELLDELQLPRAIVAGHSMGAWVAEKLAVDHPQRVAGLVLEGAFGPGRESEAIVALSEETARLEDPVDPGFVREFQVSTTNRPVPADFIDMVVAESLRMPARVWRDVGRGFLEIDLSTEYREIDAPTLLVWGDQDAFVTRTELDRLAREIPNATRSVYEGTGHAVHWDEPRRFAGEVAAFVKALGERPAVAA